MRTTKISDRLEDRLYLIFIQLLVNGILKIITTQNEGKSY